MSADGSIVIDMTLDNKPALSDLKSASEKINREMKETEKSLKSQENELEKSTHALVEVEKRYKSLNAQIEQVKESTRTLIKSFTGLQTASPAELGKSYKQALQSNEAYNKLIEQQKELKKEYKSALKVVDAQEQKHQETLNVLTQQKETARQIAEQIQSQSSIQNEIPKKIDKSNANVKKIKLNFSGFNKSMLRGLKTLSRYALALIGIRGIYTLINGAVRTWLDGTEEKAKQLKADIAFLKYAVADMLAPAIENVVGLFHKLLGLVNALMKSFTGVDFLAKSLAKYTEKTKKNMNGTLASFDQLEVQGKKENTPSSFDDDTAQFESFAERLKTFFADITSDMDFTNLLSTVQMLKPAFASLGEVAWDYLISAYKNFLKPVATLVINKALPEFVKFLSDVLNWLAETMKILKPYWDWFLSNVMLPIASWVINDFLPTFFDMLRSALDLLTPVMEIFCIVFQEMWDIFFEPIAKFTGGIIIWFLKTLTSLFKSLGNWMKENKTEIATFIELFLGFLAGIFVYASSKPIITFLMNLNGWLDSIILTIKKYGILASIGIVIENFKMTMLGLKTALAGINLTTLTLAGTIGMLVVAVGLLIANWDKMNSLERVIGVVGAVTLAVTALCIAVIGLQSAWSLGLAAAVIVTGVALVVGSISSAKKRAEQEAKQSISEAQSIPKLAKGGITYQPTQAIIGEAGREAVLPLENNTEWMDDLANRINSKGNVTIEFTGSLSQLGRVLRPVIKDADNRIGVRRIVGGADV